MSQRVGTILCVGVLAAALCGCSSRGMAPPVAEAAPSEDVALSPAVRAAHVDVPGASPSATFEAAPSPPGAVSDPGPAIRTEQFRLAYRLMLKGQFRRAEGKLVALVAQYEEVGATEGLAEVLFWLGHCREQLGRGADSAAIYRRLLKRFPGSDYAGDARERVSVLAGAATRAAGP